MARMYFKCPLTNKVRGEGETELKAVVLSSIVSNNLISFRFSKIIE